MKKRIIIIALCLAFPFFTMCSCKDSSGIGAEGISLEEFNQIQNDMRLVDVKELIGGEGTEISEKKETTDEYYKYTYLYRFEGEKTGYAEIEFTMYSYKDILKLDISGPRVSGKTQHDLT